MALGSLGSLVVSLAADTAKFQGDLGRAAAIAERRMRNIKDTASRALGALTIAASAAGTALVASLGSSLRRADDLLKLSQAVGTTVENLSALVYAGNLAGVSQDEVGNAMKRLARSSVDASRGLSEPLSAFKALGISVKDANGQIKPTDALLAEIADKFAAAADGTTKTALAMQLLGKSGASLIPLLNGGSKGLEAMRKEAEAFGQIVSTKTAKSAEQFNDNLDRMRGIVRGFGNLLAGELAQPLANLTDRLLASQKNTQALGESAKTAATFLKILASVVIGVGTAFQAAGKALGAWIAGLVAFAKRDFRGALVILEEGLTDAQTTIGNAIDLIGALFEEGGAQAAAAAPALGEQLAAPVTEGAKLTGKALEEYQRFLNQAVQIRNDAAGRLDQPLGPSLEENARSIAATMAAVNRENVQLSERTIKLAGNFLEVDKNAQALSATLRDEGIRRAMDHLSNAIAGAGGNVRDFASDVLDAFRRILTDKLTAQLIELFAGFGTKGSSGSGFLGTVLGAIGSVFSGGVGSGSSSAGGSALPRAAAGGYIPPGGMAVAGEAGSPEVVVAGKTGAAVIPLPRMAQRSAGPAVTIVNQIDARGADVGLIQRLPEILAQSNQDAVDHAVARVDQLMRGGYYA